MVQHSLADIFFEHQRGSGMGLYVLALSGGTFLGPLVAGLIASSRGWRAIGWIAAICCGVLLGVMLFTLEETAFDRAAYLQREGGPENGEEPEKHYQSQQLEHVADAAEMENTGAVMQEKRKSYLQRMKPLTLALPGKRQLFQGYIYRLRHSPRCFLYPAVLFSGLQWGAQITFLTFYLSVEDVQYHAPPWNYSDKSVAIMAVPCLVGLLGITYASWVADYFVVWMARRNSGMLESEHRLWLLLPCSVIGSLGLLLFGLGASNHSWDWGIPYVRLGCIGSHGAVPGTLACLTCSRCTRKQFSSAWLE